MTRTVRILAGILALGAAVLLGTLWHPLPARAETQAATLNVDATLAVNGTLEVAQTLTFKGDLPETIVQRLATTADAGRDTYFSYQIDQVAATAGDVDLGATTTTDGDYLVITVPTAKAGDQAITMSYRVVGAVSASQAKDSKVSLFSWRFLQGLSVGVNDITGTVRTPGVINSIDCKAGAPVAPGACKLWAAGTDDAPNPTFTDGPRGPGEVVILSFGVAGNAVQPNANVERHWSLDHAFGLNATSITLTALTLLLGAAAVYLMHRRAGRDVQAVGEPLRLAEFAPVGPGQSEFRLLTDIRPGQIGTVADERVDPVDVTATLMDLAVRGHLRIHELPQAPHLPMDWRFERLEGGRGHLHDYEQRLLDAVAPSDGDTVTVSQMAAPVGAVIPDVQSDLYEEVVAQGWFDKRPDAIRNSWAVAGWVGLGLAVVVTVLLAAFTNLALWGLAMIVVALAVVLVSPQMPRRSALGSRLLAGLHVLSTQLQHQPTDQMPPERVYADLSEVLPYAVVLGGVQRWLQAIADADDDTDEADPEDLHWYHATGDWQLADLPPAIDAFIITVEGRLFGR